MRLGYSGRASPCSRCRRRFSGLKDVYGGRTCRTSFSFKGCEELLFGAPMLSGCLENPPEKQAHYNGSERPCCDYDKNVHVDSPFPEIGRPFALRGYF